MRSNLRKIIPLWVLLSIIYFMTYLIDVFFRRHGELVPEGVTSFRLVFICFSAVMYGVFRVSSFHPALNKQYMVWLWLSPWTPDKPLPHGPVRLCLVDVVVIGFHLLLAYLNDDFLFVMPLLFFLAAYLVKLMIGLVEFGQGEMLAIGFFLAPFAVYPFKDIYVGLAVLCLIYCIGCYYSGRSLKRPWKIWYWKSDAEWHKQLVTMSLDAKIIGWPYKALRIDVGNFSVSIIESVQISLFVGWYVHVILWLLEVTFLYGFLAVVVVVLALCRLASYVSEHLPPISLFGRIATGRLIICGYDKILLAPLCSAGVGLVGPVVLGQAGVGSNLSMELSLSFSIFLLLALGPSRQQWELTGHHRIVGGSRMQQRSKSSVSASNRLKATMTVLSGNGK